MALNRKLTQNQDRKEPLMNAGQQVMQSNSLSKVTGKSNLKRFPTDQEIEAFQAQLNSESIKSLAEAFKNSTSDKFCTL